MTQIDNFGKTICLFYLKHITNYTIIVINLQMRLFIPCILMIEEMKECLK